MGLIDTHAHLNFPDFREELEAVIERTFAGGVEAVINVGTDLTTSQESVNLAARYQAIYATVGVHPHFADKFFESFEHLKSLARQPKVVAIGETGLDYFRNLSGRDPQLQAFTAQLDLAVTAAKPVVLHCRDAYTEVLGVLERDYIPRLGGRLPGVIHSFAAGPTYAQKFLRLGFYIGINNLITYPKSTALQEAVKLIPLDRIIIETDCPYLPPQTKRGERSEPLDVAPVVRALAELKGVSVRQVEEMTTANARRLFQLD